MINAVHNMKRIEKVRDSFNSKENVKGIDHKFSILFLRL